MSKDDTAAGGMDQVTKFWTDMMGQMAGGGMGASGAAPDMMAQMRKTFFSMMAEQADDYMRSEPFLNAMKQSMDNSLKFRQQINQFLNQTLQTAQMPTRSDTDHLVVLVRGMEDRLLSKLDELTERVEGLEAKRNGSPAESKSKGKPQSRTRK